MFGLGRSVTLALVGWLWADILLGLFVIFLAAASPPVPATAQSGPSIDPKAIDLVIPVDGSKLLSGDPATVASERAKFVDAVKNDLLQRSESRKVALVFAYGAHADPIQGEKLAKAATADLNTGEFNGAVVEDMHDIVPGDTGTKVELEIYVYR